MFYIFKTSNYYGKPAILEINDYFQGLLSHLGRTFSHLHVFDDLPAGCFTVLFTNHQSFWFWTHTIQYVSHLGATSASQFPDSKWMICQCLSVYLQCVLCVFQLLNFIYNELGPDDKVIVFVGKKLTYVKSVYKKLCFICIIQ